MWMDVAILMRNPAELQIHHYAGICKHGDGKLGSASPVSAVPTHHYLQSRVKIGQF